MKTFFLRYVNIVIIILVVALSWQTPRPYSDTSDVAKKKTPLPYPLPKTRADTSVQHKPFPLRDAKGR